MKTEVFAVRWASLILLGLSLCQSAWSIDVVRYEQGKAWNPDKTRVLYTESHWTQFSDAIPVARTVLYQCADGAAFARKEISYTPSRTAPAFTFKDVRQDYQEGLRWQDGKPRLWHSLAGVRQDKSLPVHADLVADAGFDQFVKARWALLIDEGRQPLRFAVPARLNSYAFKLQGTGTQRYRNNSAQAFTLGLDGWLGMLTPDIEVLYASDSRRLLRFKGISNIRDDAGNGQIDTVIEFPLADALVPLSEKTRAQAVVLKSCRVN